MKIKQWRIIKNLTQAELARKSKIDQSYISVLESGHRGKSPTIKVLEQIASSLEICVFELMECECQCNDCGICNKNRMV